ncbi:MAG TPA: PQQ-binding-like beta-propeller repeat protein [Planctomycetota bacterium]|nr:PQQ-binding-like beta-propeller repeat protein [Planctomycetota bacterium]
MHSRMFFAAVLFIAASSFASDSWPQWRGPGGQGHSDAKGLPLTWSEKENVKWKSPDPGEGWSSPCIEGDLIWMTTSQNAGKSLRAVCYSLTDGKQLHDVEVFSVEAPEPKHKLNSYASPSPLIEDGKVYVNFGTYGTACLDAKTGKKIWENRELKIDHENGPGSTPMIHKDKIHLCCDGRDLQFQAALDKATGKLVWKTDRSQPINKGKDMKKAYGTPLVINVGGKDQVIATAAEAVYAYDVDTGKELWYVKYPGFSNVPRPVYGNGLLYVCTGFARAEIWAIKPEGSGDLSASNVVWKAKIQVPTIPSPLLLGERIYMVSDTGTLSCLDAKTGKEVWKQLLGGEYSSSPLFADGRIYLFDRAGVSTVIEPGDTFKVLAKNTLEDGFMASPAIAGKALILRTKKNLYRIEK